MRNQKLRDLNFADPVRKKNLARTAGPRHAWGKMRNLNFAFWPAKKNLARPPQAGECEKKILHDDH